MGVLKFEKHKLQEQQRPGDPALPLTQSQCFSPHITATLTDVGMYIPRCPRHCFGTLHPAPSHSSPSGRDPGSPRCPRQSPGAMLAAPCHSSSLPFAAAVNAAADRAGAALTWNADRCISILPMHLPRPLLNWCRICSICSIMRQRGDRLYRRTARDDVQLMLPKVVSRNCESGEVARSVRAGNLWNPWESSTCALRSRAGPEDKRTKASSANSALMHCGAPYRAA